jgi:hypothetical protein
VSIVLSPTPIPVKQEEGPHCWAAAVTSWIALNRDRPQLNQRQLIDRYGNPEKGGSISFRDPKWPDLERDMRFANSVIVHLRTFEDVKDPNERAKRKRLQEREFKLGVEFHLLKFGYLLMVFNHTRSRFFGFVSHMVVVFGTMIVDEELNLQVMDPTKGGLRPMPIFELLGNPTVLLHTIEQVSKSRKPFPKVTEFPDE